MNTLTSSPSAMMLLICLFAIVALQVAGDTIEVIGKRRKQQYHPQAIYLIPNDSMTAALIVSNQQLRNHRQRVVNPYGKQTTKNVSGSVLRPSIIAIVGAATTCALVLCTEGFIIALTFVMSCMVLLMIIGLLAWHPSKKLTFNNKLAIALLAPVALFVKQ